MTMTAMSKEMTLFCIIPSFGADRILFGFIIRNLPEIIRNENRNIYDIHRKNAAFQSGGRTYIMDAELIEEVQGC